MQFTIDNLDNLSRRVNIQIPADKIESEITSRLQRLTRSAKVKGFRPGKVPVSVVQQMYGPQVQAEVIEELSTKSYQEVLEKEALQPATKPDFDVKQYVSGQDYGFAATFEVFPEVSISGLDSMTIKRPKVDISDADIDTVVEKLRSQRATFTEVDRAIQDGDEVEVSISGEAAEGSELPESVLNERSFTVMYGAENNWEPLADAIKGAKANDEVKFDHTFPEENTAEEIAGKTASYTVQVKQVREPALPEVDAEFIAGFGLTDGTVETFRAEVKKDMEKEAGRLIHSKVREQIVDYLVEQNNFDLPKGLVDDEVINLKESVKQRQGEEALVEIEKSPEKTVEAAERSVRTGLIFREVIREQKLVPTREQIKEKVDQIASQYEQPAEVAQYYLSDQNAYQQVHAIVIDELVIKWLEENAKIEDDNIDFQSLVTAASNA